jgi:hypothetical protein
MGFITKINLKDNRQHFLPEKVEHSLSGKTIFGLPFSALTTGPDLTTSGVTQVLSDGVGSFTSDTSTNTMTFLFPHGEMSASTPNITQITPSNSGDTQEISIYWVGYNPITIDGNTSYQNYSGVTYELEVTSMTSIGVNIYSGDVSFVDIVVYSAGTLDYLDRLIWIENNGILKTKKLIVEDGAVPGYVLTALNSNGDIGFSPVSGGSAITYWESGDIGQYSIKSKNHNAYIKSSYSIIGGGKNNTINILNYNSVYGNIIGGGDNNTMTGNTISKSSIIGGKDNIILSSGSDAVHNSGIFCGSNNHIEDGSSSTILGGWINKIYSSFSIIGGGKSNIVIGDKSSILGGENNISYGYRSVILGGQSNYMRQYSIYDSLIIGGKRNVMDYGNKYVKHSIICGGYNNYISNSNSSLVFGGRNNELGGNFGSIISGGKYNQLFAGNSSIIGGRNNLIHSYNDSNNSIISGENNIIDVVTASTLSNSVIIGGSNCSIEEQTRGTIISASRNSLIKNSSYCSIIGGYGNYINNTNNSVAFGQNVIVTNRNSFCGGRGYSKNDTNVAYGDTSFSFQIVENTYGKLGAKSNGSVVLGGKNNDIYSTADYSGIFCGANNNISSGVYRSVIIGGSNITATQSDVVYVPDLIIDGLTSTDPIATDANGKIVAGTSDRRLKKNIKKIENVIDKLLQIDGVSFEYTEESNMGPGIRFGFIAQDVQKVIPEIVRERSKGDGMLTLNYNEFIPFIVEALKEILSGKKTIKEITTEYILAEDNDIELNYNGTTETAREGGIKIKKGVSENIDSTLTIDEEGGWVAYPYIKSNSMIIPKYTPTSTNDPKGKVGEITWDEEFIYIKRNKGWGRCKLEDF